MTEDFPFSDDALFAPHDGPLDCAAVRERLPLFVGGDLDDADTRAVEVHLARCAACRELERGAVRMRQVYFETASREPSADLWPGVRAALVAEGVLPAVDGSPVQPPTPVATVEALTQEAAPVIPRRRAVLAGSLSLAAAALITVGLWSADARQLEQPPLQAELAVTPLLTAEQAAAATEAAPTGLRAIGEEERMINGQPVLQLRLNGGPESLASDVRVR